MDLQTAAQEREQVFAARREGRMADAYECARGLVGSARPSGDPEVVALALSTLAQVERDRGRLAEADRLYGEVLALTSADESAGKRAHVLRHASDVARELGHLDRAAELLEDALLVYRGDPSAQPGQLANALRSAALLNQEQGNDQAARAFWTEARALYADLGIQAGVEECDSALDP